MTGDNPKRNENESPKCLSDRIQQLQFCICEKGTNVLENRGNLGYSYINVFIVPEEKYTFLKKVNSHNLI